jgi:hypothetical protein
VTGDENDLLAAAASLELLLQTKPVQSRHAHIENQTDGAFEKFPSQIIFRGSKRLGGVPGRSEQPAQPAPNRLIVIDHADQFCRAAHATS